MIRSLGSESAGDSTRISLSLGDFPTTTSAGRQVRSGYNIIGVAGCVNGETDVTIFVQQLTNISIMRGMTEEFTADKKVNTISDLENPAVGPRSSSRRQLTVVEVVVDLRFVNRPRVLRLGTCRGKK